MLQRPRGQPVVAERPVRRRGSSSRTALTRCAMRYWIASMMSIGPRESGRGPLCDRRSRPIRPACRDTSSRARTSAPCLVNTSIALTFPCHAAACRTVCIRWSESDRGLRIVVYVDRTLHSGSTFSITSPGAFFRWRRKNEEIAVASAGPRVYQDLTHEWFEVRGCGARPLQPVAAPSRPARATLCQVVPALERRQIGAQTSGLHQATPCSHRGRGTASPPTQIEFSKRANAAACGAFLVPFIRRWNRSTYPQPHSR